MNECDNKFYTLKQVFQELNLTPSKPDHYLKYEQVFTSPWAPSINLEQRHAELNKVISKWPVDEINNHDVVDPLMLFCLGHVILFSSDFVDGIKDTKKVNNTQMKYLSMLHRYLKHKYNGEANNRFGKGIMIASFVRESNEIKRKRLPV